MPIMKQLTIPLENKPAQLAKVCGVLSGASVNILALTVINSLETSLVRFVPDNAATAKRILRRLGLPCTAKRVLVHTLPGKSGSLAMVTRILAKAGINIEYVYGSEPANHSEGLIVFGVEDPKGAESILKGK